MDKAFSESIKDRLLHIGDADRTYATASEHRGKARYGQAAKTLEMAADVYRSVSLGLLAKKTYLEAVECYEHIENAVGARRCGLRANSLPDYWTEANHDAKWG
jgi:hypothetical protein